MGGFGQRFKNQIAVLGITRNRLFVLVVALVVLVIGWRAARILACTWIKPSADASKVEQAVLYLRKYAWNVTEVRHMYGIWSESQAMFPKVYLDVCSNEEMAYQCKVQREEMTIGKSIWEAEGSDALAFRALAIFGEYQHTASGGAAADVQSTQAVLESVRNSFPPEDLTTRVKQIHHRGTINHE